MKDVKEGGEIKFAKLIGKNVGLVSGSQWEDCNDEAKAEAKAKSFKKGRKVFFPKLLNDDAQNVFRLVYKALSA